VAGWNPSRLAALPGVACVEQTAPPSELIASPRMLLNAAPRAVRQVPDDRLDMRSPDRARPLASSRTTSFM
jgi:hypothetical protein